jgi:hypothetical protein
MFPALEKESHLRDIKFEYLVLVLLGLANMLVQVLQTVLSFERSGLVAIRILVSPNLGRGIFVGLVDEDDPDLAFKTEVKALDPGELLLRHSVLERRINARCKGLLDVYADSSGLFAFGGHRDDFFHRTVRDFLKLEESQAPLVRHVPKSFNASLSICRANLILIPHALCSQGGARARHTRHRVVRRT